MPRTGFGVVTGGPGRKLVSMSEVTHLLDAAAAGDRRPRPTCSHWSTRNCARLAAARMASEAAGHTLQPTALVHEAYLRLVGAADRPRWDGRGHFFAAAAEAMRRILVEAARRRHGPARGGHLVRRELDPDHPAPPDRDETLLALDEALDRLAAVDVRAAEVVKLRYFAGLSVPEAAAALGVSPRTADADWAYARAWLVAAIRDGE